MQIPVRLHYGAAALRSSERAFTPVLLGPRRSGLLYTTWQSSAPHVVAPAWTRTRALQQDLASEAEKFIKDIETQEDTTAGDLETQYESLRSQVCLRRGF